MALQEEIDKSRQKIRADGYPVSIGELASMYQQGDLDIHPAFQRFFRWDEQQKSKWIESLLLGIPTPSLFVAQREDGVWDVVDGLQRISTIFEFMGILKAKDGALVAPLVLQGTKQLPSLEGVSWDSGDGKLTDDQRRFLKREKLDMKIVLRESDDSSKYELFQRLNTGGSKLSDQELRNCMLVGKDESFFDWLEDLASSSAFSEIVPLPHRLLDERFDLELVLRFIIFRNIDIESIRSIRSLGDFITERMIKLVEQDDFDRKSEKDTFEMVHESLRDALGEDAFRRWDAEGEKFKGPFLVSAFEIVSLGLGNDAADKAFLHDSERLKNQVIQKLWGEDEQIVTKAGESAVARLPRTLEVGRGLFVANAD